MSRKLLILELLLSFFSIDFFYCSYSSGELARSVRGERTLLFAAPDLRLRGLPRLAHEEVFSSDSSLSILFVM